MHPIGEEDKESHHEGKECHRFWTIQSVGTHRNPKLNAEHDVAGQGAGRHKSDASEVFGGPTGRTGTSNARAPIARASWHLDVDSVHPGV